MKLQAVFKIARNSIERNQDGETGERSRLNKVLLSILVTALLISSLSLAYAEIKITPPPNWQPAPINNSTTMVWFQNSTKSVFGIIKPQLNIKSPLLFLAAPYMGPFIAQILADQGVLESTDQTSFGKSNFGYRYFVNLSSLSKALNSSDTLVNKSHISEMLSSGYDVPFKGMFILTLKKGDLYGIFFLSPRENFDSTLNELKPTIDSIQFNSPTQQSLLIKMLSPNQRTFNEPTTNVKIPNFLIYDF